MAHNIWNSRFYGHRQAAWHGLGKVNEQTQTAEETLALIGGNYAVETAPLFYQDGETLVPISHRVILRAATSDDPQQRVFGLVGPEYELIPPMDAARMWDKETGAPVETMAFLGKGEQMFITATLPTVDVAGFDQVRNYLLFSNPMKSGMGAAAYITSVRTVCENTLRSGIAAASEHYTISHRAGGKQLLGDWLKDRWDAAHSVVGILHETYEILAKKRVKDVQVQWIAETLYPLPPKPDRERPRLAKWADVKADWERLCEKALTLRQTVYDLHTGAGTGLDDSRIRGTAWSAWNAVAEVESWRRGRSEAMVISLTNGERANRIIQAQDLLLNIHSRTSKNDIREKALAYAAQ